MSVTLTLKVDHLMGAGHYSSAWSGDIEETWRRRDAMYPTGKQGEPQDIAYVTLFLASDKAKFMTGKR